MNVIKVDFKTKKKIDYQNAVRVQKYEQVRLKCQEFYHLLESMEENKPFRDHARRCMNAIVDGYVQLFKK